MVFGASAGGNTYALDHVPVLTLPTLTMWASKSVPVSSPSASNFTTHPEVSGAPLTEELLHVGDVHANGQQAGGHCVAQEVGRPGVDCVERSDDLACGVCVACSFDFLSEALGCLSEALDCVVELAFLLVETLAPPIQEPVNPDEKDDVDDEADGDECHYEDVHPAASGSEQVDGYRRANERLHVDTSAVAASGFGCLSAS